MGVFVKNLAVGTASLVFGSSFVIFLRSSESSKIEFYIHLILET